MRGVEGALSKGGEWKRDSAMAEEKKYDHDSSHKMHVSRIL